MAIAIWDDSYRTGNIDVDTQHQHLFEMVNDLHDAIMSGKSKEASVPTLIKLAKYTFDHFRSEEDLMVTVNYPGMASHRRKHEDLNKRVKELVEKYRADKCVLTITLSNFLADWLRHHIKEDDMALVKYVKAHPPHKESGSSSLRSAKANNA